MIINTFSKKKIIKMPEGPEHYKAAKYINEHCAEKIFCGKIIKSFINHRNPEVIFTVDKYTIFACSRGKEMMLSLIEWTPKDSKVASYSIEQRSDDKNIVKQEDDISNMDCKSSFSNNSSNIKIKPEPSEIPYENLVPSDLPLQKCNIVFQFGMSGQFIFSSPDVLHKHSHLMFYTDEPKSMVLSFVDVRRFGKWRICDKFSIDRGPDPVNEYTDFRKNVLENLDQKVFQKPICEVLHNQKFFNGLGNYLRAEILYRSKIPPFDKARDVLENLPVNKEKGDTKLDLLDYCSRLPFEVMMLDGAGYDPSSDGYSLFQAWLQCYYKPTMKNLIDHDGRTIWFQGLPGKMAPTGLKASSRHTKTFRKSKSLSSTSYKKPIKTTSQEKDSAKPKTFKEADLLKQPMRKKRNISVVEKSSKKTKTNNIKVVVPKRKSERLSLSL